MARLLSVRGLSLSLPGAAGRIRPVDGVDFELNAGESIGLVGESGCGKSLSALTLLGLTRSLPGAKIAGQASWSPAEAPAVDLLSLGEAELTRVRGGQIAMVFQDPLSALNPLLRVDYQISEVLRKHRKLRGKPVARRVVELLDVVGIPQAEQRARQYPHQLSGGIRQRVLLAIALAGSPRLLIADEPTTALDVTVQAQILHELKQLQAGRGLAILFITHDLGVVAQICQRVLVMYAGRIVEQAPVDEFFARPQHPYSQGLLASLPSMAATQEELPSIPGSPPRPGDYPPGCRFHPRCALAAERCRSAYPEWFGTVEQRVACWEHERAAALAPAGAGTAG